jgi:hypothetical protein
MIYIRGMEPKWKQTNWKIQLVMAMLMIFYSLYWPGKLLETPPAFFLQFYLGVLAHNGLFFVLTLLGIASVFVDFISRYDEINPKLKRMHLVLVAALVLSFAFQILTSVIDIYITGHVE